MKIAHLVKKEFLETIRQRELLFIMLVAPIIQIIILGYVVTTDIKHIPVEIVNLSKHPDALNIIERVDRSPQFKLKKVHTHYLDPIAPFRQSRVKAIMIIRDSNENRMSAIPPYPEIQILMDGVDSNSSQIAAGYFNGIVKSFILSDLKKEGKPSLISSKPLIRFNPSLESINYMGPGIVALLLTIITLFLTSISLVREKEQQTIDTLLISELRPIEIYIGKMAPMAIVGLIDMIIGIFVVVWWFEIPIWGNILYLFVAAIIYLVAILSYAMLISIAASTQQQALFFSWFSMITFIMMSGIFTPVKNIPGALRWIADINPLRYLISIIREIFLKGNSPSYFWEELVMMGIIALVITTLSLLSFNRLISK